MKFNVCVSSSSPHTAAFAEVAESVAWALGTLGHTVTRTTEPTSLDDPGTRNIIFGMRPNEPIVQGNSIIYNGEQVNKDGMWPQLVAQYKACVAAGCTIWDYSAANARLYGEWGLPQPYVVRPGYCPLLDDGRFGEKAKSFDVVFFGSTNDRREKVLQEIEQRGFSVLRVPFGVYGEARDALIASAKICVNIHYYDSAIFEAVRCSYLAQCGMPVISESSVAGENTLWGISGISYNSLASFVCGALGGNLEMYGRSLVSASTNVSLVDDIKNALAAESRATEAWATKLGVQSITPVDGPAAKKLESWHASAQGLTQKRTQQLFTLCMIVKDEADVIERCLASVKPFLSRWCIVDTGSTDGTQDIIRAFLADIPGQIHERPWKEFDGSRSEAIDLARAECQDQGWLLQIDADETLQVDGDLELPENAGHDCYDAWITRCDGCVRWARPMLMRANKPWFYEMPRHEGLYCRTHAPTAPQPLPNVLVMSSTEGARAKVGARERFLNDAKVLEAWLPHHPGHTRCQYYIAQSYHCAATATDPPDRTLLQKAVMAFLKRAEMPNGYPEETFSARLLAGNCMSDMGFPWERVQQTWLQAYAMRPSRAEPLYNIARHYRVMGDIERAAGRPSAPQYALAEIFARKASLIGPPADKTPQFDPSVNDWRAKDELATALTFLSGHAEARELYRHILRVPEIPPHDRARIEANLEMCIQCAPDPA